MKSFPYIPRTSQERKRGWSQAVTHHVVDPDQCCEFRDSQSSVDEDSSLLGYETLSIHKQSTKFRRSMFCLLHVLDLYNQRIGTG
jgi:hypothetical protein